MQIHFPIKPKFLLPLAICFLLMASACKKDPKYPADLPKVTVVSATIQPDNTLLIRGTIESSGTSVFDNVGICYNSHNNPGISDHRADATLRGDTFSVVYDLWDNGPVFDFDSTYYFRAWAVNDDGYSYGNTIAADSLFLPSIMSSPCMPALNTVDLGALGTFSYSNISAPSNRIDATTSNGFTVTYIFGSTMRYTGGYPFLTTTSQIMSPGFVKVSFTNGTVSGVLDYGSNIYINHITPDVYDVIICNAPWVNNSSTEYFSTRMRVTY